MFESKGGKYNVCLGLIDIIKYYFRKDNYV